MLSRPVPHNLASLEGKVLSVEANALPRYPDGRQQVKDNSGDHDATRKPQPVAPVATVVLSYLLSIQGVPIQIVSGICNWMLILDDRNARSLAAWFAALTAR